MAAQSGIGVTRALLLLGLSASYPFLAKNGKISEILNDLQEKLNSGDVFGDVHEDLNKMVRLLATEVQNMVCTRSISILKTNSANGGSFNGVTLPAVTLGLCGGGFMWWKGLSFSDIMYVTKHNMEGAVSRMKKNLEAVSSSLSSVRNHLTQQIQNLDDKVEEQKEISKEIRNELSITNSEIVQVECKLGDLQKLLYGLQGEIRDQKRLQGFACTGVQFLCESVGAQTGRMPDSLQDMSKTPNKCGYFLEDKSLKGLLRLTDMMESGITDPPRLDATKKIEIDSLDNCVP
ncbi:hypothetical protein QJS04_geneDACA004922 [Acorus gramineus]|uniref:DUF1664 domain-containing protein n=1 Tax=Acorus gramineus TaxID=55184 RepID=A0AAV9BTX9_ACOGR|nr:hypothetical protein QJS04_geneDACA004922 [Acorus gramineus]